MSIILPTLRGIADADVYDTYEPCVLVGVTPRSRLTRRVGALILGGAGQLTKLTADAGDWCYVAHADNASAAALCSHYAHVSYIPRTTDHYGQFSADRAAGDIYICLYGVIAANTVTAAEAWLAAQNAAGTPVTIHYVLATPQVTLGDPVSLAARDGYTRIITSSPVQGQITASVLAPTR